MAVKKKLIEVALPLEAINAESAREKSIRHGHPSTLHLWWARRPRAGLPANPRRAQHTRRGWGTWALYLALIVYAMCAPLFGISLVVFLALSSGWRALRRRQLGRRQAQGFEAQI